MFHLSSLSQSRFPGEVVKDKRLGFKEIGAIQRRSKSQMESGVKVEIHHGGQFTTKNGIRYYKGESDRIEIDNHSDADDNEYDKCESEESENESIDIEDEYDTDHDEEFVDIIKKKKEVYQAKKNPMEAAYEEN
ncbi:hypothetical protein ACET3Z_032079 [Daucus carota]